MFYLAHNYGNIFRCFGANKEGFKRLDAADKALIAADLFIAEGTVKNHITNILSKLGVRDRTQAALKARKMGLI